MTSQKELILYQLANLVDKILYYSVPIEDFSGQYPDDLPEPTECEPIQWHEKGNRPAKAVVVPGVILKDLAKLIKLLDE